MNDRRLKQRFERRLKQGALRVTLGRWVATGWAAAALVACSTGTELERPTGTLSYEAQRPTVLAAEDVPRYTGQDEFVLAAETQHRTGLELHRNVVIRTCGPTGGVCHNRKEYPDLHTPANFLNAIGAPCNVQSGDHEAVYDGCEEAGDRFRFNDSAEVEIGYIDYIPGEETDYGDDFVPDAETPGLHIYLAAGVRTDDDRPRRYGSGRFVRSFVNNDGNIENVAYETFDTQWYFLDDGQHLFGQVRNYQVDRVQALIDVGVKQGDMNRNGIYGASSSATLNMIEAGAPEASYLIGRLRGELGAEKIPGTRMPLANDPLTIPDMLALYCFIEGLPANAGSDVVDLETPINYEDCRWSDDPEGLNLLGNGATWRGRVQPLLAANCGGCHGGDEPQGDLLLLGEGTYEILLGQSLQSPGLPLVAPGDPDGSYLWQKLVDAEGIVGLGMPIDPLEGVRTLSEGALADIETWILNGALEEE